MVKTVKTLGALQLADFKAALHVHQCSAVMQPFFWTTLRPSTLRSFCLIWRSLGRAIYHTAEWVSAEAPLLSLYRYTDRLGLQ